MIHVHRVVAPEAIMKEIVGLNQYTHYCVPTPLQQAVATILQQALQPYEGHANYYAFLSDRYQRKRDSLVRALEDANMKPFVPEGGAWTVCTRCIYLASVLGKASCHVSGSMFLLTLSIHLATCTCARAFDTKPQASL